MSGVTTATVLAGAGLALTAGSTIYTMLGQKPGGGGAGATPPVAAPPEVPKLEDPSIAAASALQASNAARAQGQSSTILTSGLGDTSKATTAKKALLGG